MSTTTVSEPERLRLEALRRYDILDTPPDGSFDHIAALAAKLFSVPIAIVSLVDTDRIWFKAHHGLDVDQVERVPGLCASVILGDTPYVLTDALSDPRVLANPLVAGAFGLRFYAAAPLLTTDGYRLGTLCVIDHKPRKVTDDEIDHLTNLAAVVMDQMELRLSARRAIAEVSRALGQAEMLGREIDHRVKNSLQFVVSVLEMQGLQTEQSEVARQLKLAASRVATVARVHRHFYVDESVERICALNYLRRLCADIGKMLGSAEVTVGGPSILVATTRIMPLGLIINELITNAAKHDANVIRVTLERAGDGFTVCVSNDGEALPGDFDPYAHRGLGMRIIMSLMEQIDGRLDFGLAGSDLGARFTVTASTGIPLA